MPILGLAAVSIVCLWIYVRSQRPAHKTVSLLIWLVTAAYFFGVRIPIP